jgi:hypothetical protein
MARAIFQRALNKGVSVQHPQLTAWVEFGAGVRISLRQTPVIVSLGVGDDAPAAVITVRSMSGPFFERADPQKHN